MTVRYIAFAIALVATFPASAGTSPGHWLAQPEPDRIGLMVQMSQSCPMSQNDVALAAMYTLYEADLEPTLLDEFPRDLFLKVWVFCGYPKEDVWPVGITVRFGMGGGQSPTLYEYPSSETVFGVEPPLVYKVVAASVRRMIGEQLEYYTQANYSE